MREIEAIIAEREQKQQVKAQQRTPEEIERLRLRNLQYRRKYLAKKRSQRDGSH
jgi:hypothetical protein